jgi:ribosome maturation protein SDO1
MNNIEKAIKARLKISGENFEILVDSNKIFDYKEGKIPLNEVLITKEIFKDINKGEHASEHEMEKIFNTKDHEKIAEIIIQKGEIQITSEHRNKLREEKRKRIIDIIHKNSVDPKTNLPHPPQRIENAMEEAKVKIDEFKKPEDQIKEVLEKIRPILPISFETKELEIKIPPQYASQSYSVLKSKGKLKKDEWLNDGSLKALIEIPAGLQEEFENEINKITHGDCEIKLIKNTGDN